MPQQLVTKSTYATMRNRAASAVSNWIADGKLTAPALVQDPARGELIDVEAADRQLAETLDPSQQLAQAVPIGPAAAAGSADLPGGDDGSGEPKVGGDDADNKRFVKYRADRMQAEAEGLARKRQEESGKWVEAEVARQAFARELAAGILEVEGWLAPTAEILAAELGVERKAVLVILRREFRSFRERQAKAKGETPAQLAQAAE